MSEYMYTKEQLDIEILKTKNDEFHRTLSRIESEIKWILGLMGTGFFGLLGLMAHGFHWINW